MKKKLIYLSFLTMLLAASLSVSSSSYAATSSSWSQLTSWFKSKPAQPKSPSQPTATPATAPAPSPESAPTAVSASASASAPALESTPAAEQAPPASKQADLAELISQVTAKEPVISATPTNLPPISAENTVQSEIPVAKNPDQPAPTTTESTNNESAPATTKISSKSVPVNNQNTAQSAPVAVKNNSPPAPATEEPTSGWIRLNQWGKDISVSWDPSVTELPAAIASIPYYHNINLTEWVKGSSKSKLIFTLDKNHPQWLQISADGQSLQGNQFKVIETATQIEVGIAVMDANTKQSGGRRVFKLNIDHQGSEPRWSIDTLPPAAVRQKNYSDINLSDYVSSQVKQDNFIYSLTAGKNNPSWVSVQANGLMHIATDKISPEDVDTTQIIYLTATSSRSGKAGNAEMILKITANDQLTAPAFQRNFTLTDAVPGKNYFVNLADAVNTAELEDNDQLTFQIINSSADWLQMGENGFSLIAHKVPAEAAGKYFEAILRVNSKMSGKTNDFNGRIYVNPKPLPLQWQPAPAAAINKNYSLDLTQYISSNIKNDRFSFHIDIATLPHWLSIKNNQILSGIPQEAALLDHPQTIQVTAKSLVTGLTSKTTLVINVKPDQQLIPQWKNNFFNHPIIGETYRSDDLTTVLENRYPHDELSFEYISGPDWLGFNSMCHCLASKGMVPDSAAGQTITIKLRVHSKASGQAVDYAQSVMVYTGMPQWTQTHLPDVQIAQSNNNIEIPLSQYTQDDISGDIFTYQLDHFHSPRWINIGKKGEQYYLIINPKKISTNEVGTAQTVRVLATSQSTSKSSVQLLTINVKANPNLPSPAWKNIPLSTSTVGVEHVVDLAQYIQGSLADDRLTIKLGSDSPNWLSIKDNRLTGIPPRDQIGGPYPVNFIVYSQATNTNTVITTEINVQLVVVAEDNMEIHPFYDNHQSIVIRGLQKNHSYRLYAVKGSHFDYGPFYSPNAIRTAEDWNGNPFYAVNSDQIVKTGEEGVVSIVYYTLPTSAAPQFESLILR